MQGSKDALARLEEAARQAHRLYLTSLMRVEALEGAGVPPGTRERETAEIDRELQFRLMNAQMDRLGYVPKGLAKRAKIRREMADRAAMPAQQPRSRPGQSARAVARADAPIRSV